jgi:hypothetical protein
VLRSQSNVNYLGTHVNGNIEVRDALVLGQVQ